MLTKEDLRSVVFGLLDEFAQGRAVTTEDNYMSVEEVCEKYRVSKPTLWRWDKAGFLRSKRLGRRVLYSENSIKSAMRD